MRSRFFGAVVLVLAALTRPAAADGISVATLGDSITDPYANHAGSLNSDTGLPFWGYAGDKNWVEQLQSLRADHFRITNAAKAGVTSAALAGQLSGPSDPKNAGSPSVATLIKEGKVQYAAVIIGANDLLAFIEGKAGANPAPVITALATNIAGVVDALKAGKVNVVVANVPDLATMPYFQGLQKKLAAANDPNAATLLPGITALVRSANQAIEQVAAARGVPVIDLFQLSGLTRQPLVVGGTTVNPAQMFAPDVFHPATVPQGLLANTFLQAIHDGYGTKIDGLKLSDQDILGHAPGISVTPPSSESSPTYFDVGGCVIEPPHSGAAPSFIVVAATGSLSGLFFRRKRRSTPAGVE